MNHDRVRMATAPWTRQGRGCALGHGTAGRYPGGVLPRSRGRIQADPAPEPRHELTTADARLRFEVHAARGNLLVRRTEHVEGAGLREEHLLLASADQYRHWLDEDPVRFSDPVIYDALRRLVHELWEI